MAASPTLRQNFIRSALKMILDHGFDGFNVDWEYPNRRDTVHGQDDVQNFVQLLKELRQEFDKYGLELSAAVGAVPDAALLSYDIPGISKYLDHIGLMTYDMYGPWDPVTGHNSPLHKGEGDDNVPKEQLNTVDVAVEYWLRNGCPPEKLLLGLPLYGHTFLLTNGSVNGVRAPSSGAGLAGPYTATNGIIGYNEFCAKLQSQSWNLRYDSLAKVPYAVQGKNWVSYDDPKSLTAKVEYGLQQSVGGIMVWSIETDDFHNVCGAGKFPLLHSINQALGTQLDSTTVTTTTISSSAQTTTTTSSTKPTNITTTSGTTVAPTFTTAPNTVGTTVSALTVCKSVGLTADPKDCTSFYSCTLDPRGGYIAYKFKCPSNLHWDQKNLSCNYPSVAQCSVK
ncbi:acidic mammalian chitinase-like [Battus philenor]|uniref:acidic mammalian chitinase-like n=1 Tax=Battus philenor TaxID=42288 RepID=UPI0035D04F1A